MYPEEFRYSKDHEWIEMEGSNGRIGITDYAQDQLGDVVFVQLPKVGDSFKQNDVFGTIESVKAVSELYCPVAGEVVQVNEQLDQEPELVNEDPHGDGWMVVLKVSDVGELETLLNSEEYEQHIEEDEEEDDFADEEDGSFVADDDYDGDGDDDDDDSY